MKKRFQVEILWKTIFWAPNGRFFIIYTLSKSVLHLSFIHIRLPLGAQKILFLSILTWERFFII